MDFMALLSFVKKRWLPRNFFNPVKRGFHGVFRGYYGEFTSVLGDQSGFVAGLDVFYSSDHLFLGMWGY